MSKVAVITGSSKGIGAATAVAFANEGYDVVINYHLDDEAAQQTADVVEATGQKALVIKADVSTESGVNTLFEAVKSAFDHIDVLVNNASLMRDPPMGEWTMANVSESLSLNFMSAALCTQAAVPLMAEGGSVLFSSSIYGLNFGASPTLPLYSAGKAAIIAFAQSLAERLGPNIRCNVVAPGTTRTSHWDTIKPEYANKSLDMTIQKEWVEPEEIAAAFVFLAKTPHITSQTIVVDAGWQKKIRA